MSICICAVDYFFHSHTYPLPPAILQIYLVLRLRRGLFSLWVRVGGLLLLCGPPVHAAVPAHLLVLSHCQDDLQVTASVWCGVYGVGYMVYDV